MSSTLSVSGSTLLKAASRRSTEPSSVRRLPCVLAATNSAVPKVARLSQGFSGESPLKTGLDWPLPCPSLGCQEAECPGRTVAEVSSQPNGSASSENSPFQSTISGPKNFEVRVGVAKAGKFTAEKARLLRQKTKETESHHDLMYHSGLAARLA